MDIHFLKNKRKNPIKKRFNPHTYWILFIVFCVLAFSIELFYFSWFFIETTKVLDAPANPTLETNAVKIKSLNRKLDTVDAAISTRTNALVQ